VPCCLVVSDADFHRWGDPPVPQADRLCLAQAQPGRRALLVPACRRRGETSGELAVGFGVGTATAWRYVTETVSLLAARSPELGRALAAARDAGHACVVIDGTLIPAGRRRS
jgi:hypothetical protein